MAYVLCAFVLKLRALKAHQLLMMTCKAQKLWI